LAATCRHTHTHTRARARGSPAHLHDCLRGARLAGASGRSGCKQAGRHEARPPVWRRQGHCRCCRTGALAGGRAALLLLLLLLLLLWALGRLWLGLAWGSRGCCVC
jgi:hypothetical protein